MLVFSVTLPTSTGCLSLVDVNSRAKSFLPCFHWPASLFSVTTTSLAFCVANAFSAAQLAPPAPNTTANAVTIAIRRFIGCLPPCEVLALFVRLQRGPLADSACRALLRLSASQLSLSQPVEDDRGHDQDETERADHAAEHRRGERLHDLGAGRMAPHDRQQARHDRGDRHDLRPEP